MQGASSTLLLQLLLTVGTNTAPYRAPFAAALEQANPPQGETPAVARRRQITPPPTETFLRETPLPS
jgi:hypothetical protein